MKLPVLKGLIIVAAVLQAPATFAQRGGGPGPGPQQPAPSCPPGFQSVQGARGTFSCAQIEVEARPPQYPGEGRPGDGPRPGPGNNPNPPGPGWGNPNPGPGWGHGGGYNPRPRPRPDNPWNPNPWNPPSYPRPLPPPPPQNQYGDSSVEFSNITRRSGGEWLRVAFSNSAYVDRVSLEITRAGLKVHEAYAITNSGRRVSLRELTYGGVMYAYDSITSNYISAGERITAIDIRAESYGDYARMTVTVQSSSGRPYIYAQRP